MNYTSEQINGPSKDIPLDVYLGQIENTKKALWTMDMTLEEQESIISMVLLPANLEGEGTLTSPWEPQSGATIDNVIPTVIGKMILNSKRETVFNWSGQMVSLALLTENGKTFAHLRPNKKS